MSNIKWKYVIAILIEFIYNKKKASPQTNQTTFQG